MGTCRRSDQYRSSTSARPNGVARSGLRPLKMRLASDLIAVFVMEAVFDATAKASRGTSARRLHRQHKMDGKLLACTGPYQPSRSGWAIPRASRRSVFTVIADNAAFASRLSSSTVSKPAATRPAWIHCDNGSDWRQTRAIGSSRVRRNPAHHHHRGTATPPVDLEARRITVSFDLCGHDPSSPHCRSGATDHLMSLS